MTPFDIKPCLPSSFLRGGHLQTVVSHLISPKPYMLPDDTFQIRVDAGDDLRAHYFRGTSDVIICAFHGLSGDWTSDYMQFVAEMGLKNNHHVILWNHRGVGQNRLSEKPYNSGSVEDVGRALDETRSRYPRKKIVVVGFSLSGNIVLALAGGYKQQTPPDFSIAVNAPIDLADSSSRLKNGINRLYDYRFVTRLSRMVQDKVRIPLGATVWDFDELYTAPASGFRNREHYYAECSSYQYIEKIRTPTLILTAEDDPFVSVEKYQALKLNSDVYMHIEKHGGHMGYLSKDLVEYNHRWLKYFLDRVFQENLDLKK